MSSFGKTKKEIIELLSKRQQTLTDLSKTLDLSPSTVKQHLEELEAVGAIMPVENEFIRRWKYYKPNPEFGAIAANQEEHGEIRRIFPYAVGAVIIFAIAYALAFGLTGHILGNTAVNNNTTILGSSIPQTELMSIRLTDPPDVPPGTNALDVKYSSVEVHIVGNNTWIKTNGNGTLDLMSLVNSSQVISDVYLPQNAVIDSVKLNVTNATININGTDYSVTVASPNIKAVLEQPEEVGQNQSVLLDFSPTVATVYGINGTSFILVPALKAVFLANETRNQGNVGAVASLQTGERTALYQGQPNISIISSSMAAVPSSVEPNNQAISIEVRNNGNYTVNITQIVIQGGLQFYLNTSTKQHVLTDAVQPVRTSQTGFIGGGIGGVVGNAGSAVGAAGASWIAGSGGPAPGGVAGNAGQLVGSNGYVNLGVNGTGGAGINGSASAYWKGRVNATGFNISIPWRPMPLPTLPVGPESMRVRNATYNGSVEGQVDGTLVFFVEANGTMELPANNNIGFANPGYELKPGQTATLAFNGTLNFVKGRLEVGLIPNDTYHAVVVSSLCPVANLSLKAQ